jgi:hypothetical protein
VAAWAQSNGAPQKVIKPDGGSNQEVVVNLSAFYEGLRLRAAYFSRLNLLMVLLRTTGFYATSYATFAVSAGFPQAREFAAVAGTAWTQLQRATTDAAHARSGEALAAGGVVFGIIGVAFPPAAVFAAVAIAVAEAISALLIELGGAAVGHGIYTVQPLFVRQFVGECSRQTLTRTVEQAAGFFLQLHEREVAARTAMAEVIAELPPPAPASTFPWAPVLGGSALALLLALVLRKG